MKKVVITADSAADIPRDIADRYGIEIIPMNVIIGGEEKKDGVDITASEIFDYVDNTGKISKPLPCPLRNMQTFLRDIPKKENLLCILRFVRSFHQPVAMQKWRQVQWKMFM